MASLSNVDLTTPAGYEIQLKIKTLFINNHSVLVGWEEVRAGPQRGLHGWVTQTAIMSYAYGDVQEVVTMSPW
jgi:hypothetical protein